MTGRALRAIASEALLIFVDNKEVGKFNNTCSCVEAAEDKLYLTYEYACFEYREFTSARYGCTGFKYIHGTDWINMYMEEKRRIREANLWTFYQFTMSMDAF